MYKGIRSNQNVNSKNVSEIVVSLPHANITTALRGRTTYETMFVSSTPNTTYNIFYPFSSCRSCLCRVLCLLRFWWEIVNSLSFLKQIPTYINIHRGRLRHTLHSTYKNIFSFCTVVCGGNSSLLYRRKYAEMIIIIILLFLCRTHIQY